MGNENQESFTSETPEDQPIETIITCHHTSETDTTRRQKFRSWLDMVGHRWAAGNRQD